MDTWNFETGDGNSLCEGYQGTYAHAEAVAQRKANQIGDAVFFYSIDELSECYEADPADDCD